MPFPTLNVGASLPSGDPDHVPAGDGVSREALAEPFAHVI